jgi:hypothetical protein
LRSNLEVFTDEQSRVAINLAQQYQVWMDAKRRSASLPYGMAWKTIGGKEYLYQLVDRIGNGKSLGKRSSDTETVFAQYSAEKEWLQQRADLSVARAQESSTIYRHLRMPLISAEGAKILREADLRKMLDGQVMVVGTNAMPAYMLEANGFIIDAPWETQDFDMAWLDDEPIEVGMPIWAMLKAVDSTYTINTERTFQARNSKAFEFELLVAPSRSGTIARGDRPVPVPLPEQEWLLLGRPVDHVVVARDGSPARIVAPDPRWFALQKLWMSVQDKRDPMKRLKDRRQGTALLNVVHLVMQHYPLDAAFEAEIPGELRPHYDEWRTTAPKPHAPEWG